MNAGDFKDGSVVSTKFGKIKVEISRRMTPSLNYWCVGVYDSNSLEYIEYNEFNTFNRAEKQYKSMCNKYQN